jgi:hypothetical protein
LLIPEACSSPSAILEALPRRTDSWTHTTALNFRQLHISKLAYRRCPGAYYPQLGVYLACPATFPESSILIPWISLSLPHLYFGSCSSTSTWTDSIHLTRPFQQQQQQQHPSTSGLATHRMSSTPMSSSRDSNSPAAMEDEEPRKKGLWLPLSSTPACLYTDTSIEVPVAGRDPSLT